MERTLERQAMIDKTTTAKPRVFEYFSEATTPDECGIEVEESNSPEEAISLD